MQGEVYMEINDYEAAISCLDRSIQLHPWQNHYFFLRGKCLKQLNRLDEAIWCCDEAIRCNARYAAALFLKGDCLFEKNEVQSAKEVLKKAYEIESSQ